MRTRPLVHKAALAHVKQSAALALTPELFKVARAVHAGRNDKEIVADVGLTFAQVRHAIRVVCSMLALPRVNRVLLALAFEHGRFSELGSLIAFRQGSGLSTRPSPVVGRAGDAGSQDRIAAPAEPNAASVSPGAALSSARA